EDRLHAGLRLRRFRRSALRRSGPNGWGATTVRSGSGDEGRFVNAFPKLKDLGITRLLPDTARCPPAASSSKDPPNLFFLPLLWCVQINHRSRDVAVPEDTLNRLELRAVVEQIGRAGVPEFVRRELHAEQRPSTIPDHP